MEVCLGILKRNALMLLLGAVPCLFAGDPFPLETGNTWTYRESTTGQTFTITVGLPIFYGGHVYYQVRGYVGGDAMARIDEGGQLVYLDPEGKEALLTPLVPFDGGWYNVPLRTCDSLAQAAEKRGSHEGPAGRFSNVLDVRFQTPECADA